MQTLKNSPGTIAKVIPVTPKYILRKEAFAYCGMEETLFSKAAFEFGLTVYARGPKKIWYRVDQLNAMLESYKIIETKKAVATNNSH